jgi:hypothetical protein
MSEMMYGNTPPTVVIRGHYHTYRREFLEICSNGNCIGSWAILLPGFTFKDDYTRRATRSEFRQSVGMVALEIIDGKLVNVYPFIKTVDLRTREVI